MTVSEAGVLLAQTGTSAQVGVPVAMLTLTPGTDRRSTP